MWAHTLHPVWLVLYDFKPTLGIEFAEPVTVDSKQIDEYVLAGGNRPACGSTDKKFAVFLPELAYSAGDGVWQSGVPAKPRNWNLPLMDVHIDLQYLPRRVCVSDGYFDLRRQHDRILCPTANAFNSMLRKRPFAEHAKDRDSALHRPHGGRHRHCPLHAHRSHQPRARHHLFPDRPDGGREALNWCLAQLRPGNPESSLARLCRPASQTLPSKGQRTGHLRPPLERRLPLRPVCRRELAQRG